MYLFTEKNIFYAGLFYEFVGMLAILYASYLKTADTSRASQHKVIARVLTSLHKTVNERNCGWLALFILIATAIVVKLGKTIERATLEHGLFCIDNFVYLFISVFLVAIHYLVYKYLLLIDVRQDDSKPITRDKILLFLGVVIMATGLLLFLMAGAQKD